MKNAGYSVLFVILSLGLFLFCNKSDVNAREYRSKVLLKNFESSDILNINEYYNLSYKTETQRMTTLSDIKLLGEKEEIAKTIRLRAAQLLKENKETTGVYYYNIAKAYEEQGKYEKALENYKYAINSDFKCTPVYLNLGLIYAKLGNYRDSINVFLKYIELCDNSEEKSLIKEFIEKMKILAEK